MGARKATLLVMAKMALSDGVVAEEERSFLEPLLQGDETVDKLLAEAKDKKLEELVGTIENYADRFFIALRAASMASIDADLDAREEALYEKLVAVLEIPQDDQAVIKRSVAALDAIEAPPPEPRVEQLYRESSFA
ncbi:MAG: hypothetical protein AAGF12_04225 [Myxococcota bacterium]